MPDCPASGQSGTGLKKTNDAETVPYRTKLMQSGIFLVRYRTKIRDAGMPMPALVSSMPMPSSGDTYVYMDRTVQSNGQFIVTAMLDFNFLFSFFKNYTISKRKR